MRARLEGPMEGDDERVLNRREDALLGDDALQPLLLLEQPGLAHNLDGMHLPCGPVPGLDNLAGTANAHDAHDRKVLDAMSWSRCVGGARRHPSHSPRRFCELEHGLETVAARKRLLQGLAVVEHQRVASVGGKRGRIKCVFVRYKRRIPGTVHSGFGCSVLSWLRQRESSRPGFRLEDSEANHRWRSGLIPRQLLSYTAQQPSSCGARVHVDGEVQLLLDAILRLVTADNLDGSRTRSQCLPQFVQAALEHGM
mmetsp:Transcript_115577/g.326746  ORF Transcript_115577/g.326746 Transcript_115577/m.326746 type:complete len:254 (+) Transcript_115577:845-1606(+)